MNEIEVKQKIKDYLKSLADSSINIQSDFAREMMLKEIMNIIIPHVKDWKCPNEY